MDVGAVFVNTVVPRFSAIIRNSVGGDEGAFGGLKACKSIRRSVPARSMNASLQVTAVA